MEIHEALWELSSVLSFVGYQAGVLGRLEGGRHDHQAGRMALDGRLIHTRAGIAAAAARRWEQAEHHYQAALQLAEALPSRIEQADLRRLQAVARVQARAGGVGTEDEPR